MSAKEPADFNGLSDHFILRMYEFIRDQVLADATTGTRLVGLPARQRADRLLVEINRRGLFYNPIDWPPATPSDATGIEKTPAA